jgi:formamidase
MRTLSIAALQSAPVFRDPEATLELLRERLRGASAAVPHAQLLLLPELHLSAQPGLLEEQASYPDDVAVPIPGPLTDALGGLAAENGLWLVPGTVFERAEDGRLHNTALAFSPAGDLVARYRKVFPWQPHEECAPGDRFVTFDIPGVARVGLAICYDGNFPEVFRQLAWMGAEVVVQPTLTTTSDREAELVLARANAIANQLFVVNLNAAAPAGLGRSLVVDPEGLVRRQAGEGEELLTDVLDVDAVARVRELGTAGVSRMWDQAKRLVPGLELPMYSRGGEASSDGLAAAQEPTVEQPLEPAP